METTYAPSGDENAHLRFDLIFDAETTYALSGDENLSQCSKNATLLPKQLTPRQGTKTCDSSHAINTFIETTHTPSGDENNVATGKLYGLSKGNNLHPVRGRKLYHVSILLTVRFRNNLHPVRGRKLTRRSAPAADLKETTYTPSGDENKQSSVKVIFTSGNNLHPARGRKPHNMLLPSFHV